MKKIICIIVVIIAAVAAGAFVFLNINSQVSILSEEASTIKTMDINNDEVDMSLRCTGDYMAVEDAMKTYINSYLEELKNFENIMNDDALTSLLGIDNLSADLPEFLNSRALIETKKQEISTEGLKLIDMAKEENIMAALDGLGVSSFQKNLYKKMMLENIGVSFYYPESEIEKAETEKITRLDNIGKVFDFLQMNLGNWSINDSMIKFSNDQLLDEYRNLISTIN